MLLDSGDPTEASARLQDGFPVQRLTESGIPDLEPQAMLLFQLPRCLQGRLDHSTECEDCAGITLLEAFGTTGLHRRTETGRTPRGTATTAPG